MKLLKAASLISVLALWGCGGDEISLEYRDLEAPHDVLASKEARNEGRKLFLGHCAICHGENGDGHGMRRVLSSQPADLTNPIWRTGTTPENVFRTIREGVPRSPMGGFKIFSVDQTWTLVAYVWSLSERSG